MFNLRDALKFLKMIRLDIKNLPFNINELVDGLNVELEHGSINSMTNITNDDLLLTGKIALAHLFEDPKYYTKIKIIEGGRNYLENLHKLY